MLVSGDIAHRAASKAVAELVMLIERCVEQVTLVSNDRADLDTTQQLIRNATGLPARRPKSQPVWISPAHNPSHTTLRQSCVRPTIEPSWLLSSLIQIGRRHDTFSDKIGMCAHGFPVRPPGSNIRNACKS